MQHAWCTDIIERLTDGRLDVDEIAVEAMVFRKATQRLDRPPDISEQCGCVGDPRRVGLGDERAEARETAPLASAPWTTTGWWPGGCGRERGGSADHRGGALYPPLGLLC